MKYAMCLDTGARRERAKRALCSTSEGASEACLLLLIITIHTRALKCQTLGCAVCHKKFQPSTVKLKLY